MGKIISLRMKTEREKDDLLRDIKILSSYRNQSASALLRDAIKLIKLKMEHELKDYAKGK